MANVPDYSNYINVKKTSVAQTANTAIATVKGRAPYRYDGYFPLYRGIRLPVNALISNKFTGGPVVQPPTYQVTASTLTINEAGLPVVFTITTTNVADGTVLFWENIQTASSVDFAEGINSGNVTITGGTGTITLTIVADQITEGTEYIALNIRTSSVGTILATSLTVTINDTSIAPTWTITNTSANLSNTLADVDTTATGTKVMAVKGYNPGAGLTNGPIYLNTNSGIGVWPTVATNDFWKTGCFTRDGTIAYAGGHANPVRKSTDGGISWFSLASPIGNSPSAVWNSLQCSDNGNVVYGSAGFGTGADRSYLWVSVNAGVTWTSRLTLGVWSGVACSADGQYAVACPNLSGTASQLQKTSDSGSTWTAVGTSTFYNAVCCSSSGSIMYAVPTSGTTAYKSTDYGATWSSITLPATFNDIDCSTNGSFVIGVSSTKFYFSTNGGSSWTEVYTVPSSTAYRLCSSDTGTIVYFITYSGPVYKAVYA